MVRGWDVSFLLPRIWREVVRGKRRVPGEEGGGWSRAMVLRRWLSVVCVVEACS